MQSLTYDSLNKVVVQFNQKTDIPNLNRGGCGLFALELHKRLKRKGYKSVPILLTDGYSKEETTLNTIVKNGSVFGITPVNHIILYVEDKYFVDSVEVNENLKKFHYSNYSRHFPIPEKVLKYDVAREHYWNDAFDRDNHEKTVKTTLYKIFKTIQPIKNEKDSI